MDSLEKRIIYLKGIQAGIIQGTNPNVTKYKLQIDYELNSLEKEFQKIQQKIVVENKNKNNVNIPKYNTIFQKKEIVEKNIVDDIQEEENNKEEKDINDINLLKMKFMEVSKNINLFKDKIFQNNNFIKMLNRNKTYQNSLKIQNILKENNYIQIQIQQKQQIYDLLNLKINNPSLYEKIYKKESKEDKEEIKPKSILKNKSLSENPIKKHIQINMDKNEIKEIPSNVPKKNMILQKKVIHKENNNNQNNSNTLAFQNKRPEIKIEENDEDLMKEFQNTIGSLQKLLI